MELALEIETLWKDAAIQVDEWLYLIDLFHSSYLVNLVIARWLLNFIFGYSVTWYSCATHVTHDCRKLMSVVMSSKFQIVPIILWKICRDCLVQIMFQQRFKANSHFCFIWCISVYTIHSCSSVDGSGLFGCLKSEHQNHLGFFCYTLFPFLVILIIVNMHELINLGSSILLQLSKMEKPGWSLNFMWWIIILYEGYMGFNSSWSNHMISWGFLNLWVISSYIIIVNMHGLQNLGFFILLLIIKKVEKKGMEGKFYFMNNILYYIEGYIGFI